jgi:hypothetical protein
VYKRDNKRVTLSKSVVVSFFEDFVSGRLTLYCRSEPMPANGLRSVPAYPDGTVVRVVGDTFDFAALKGLGRYGALVFAYMPGCPHCKAFDEAFAALAPKFALKVAFLRMDGTKNDVDHKDITFKLGYPSIWFIGAYGGGRAVQHNSRDRSVKGMTQWISAQIADDLTRKPKTQPIRKTNKSAAPPPPPPPADEDEDPVFADDDQHDGTR